MREILFRGKFGNEWKCGYLSVEPKGLVIKEPYTDNKSEIWHIDPETVCQFTGLTDKNGRKIFEGDIIEHNHPYGGKSVHTVIWDKYGWNLSDFCATYFDYPSEAFSEGTQFMTVIGNAFNNPELLEVKQNG